MTGDICQWCADYMGDQGFKQQCYGENTKGHNNAECQSKFTKYSHWNDQYWHSNDERNKW